MKRVFQTFVAFLCQRLPESVTADQGNFHEYLIHSFRYYYLIYIGSLVLATHRCHTQKSRVSVFRCHQSSWEQTLSHQERDSENSGTVPKSSFMSMSLHGFLQSVLLFLFLCTIIQVGTLVVIWFVLLSCISHIFLIKSSF